MPNYIPFTPEQREQARQTDLCVLLERQGETLKHSGSEYEWRDGAQKVTIRGHLWFHQYEQVGGDAIDFVRRYCHMSYPEAVAFLLSNGAEPFDISTPAVKKSFSLPPPNENNRRVYAYLSVRRGIDRDVLNAFHPPNTTTPCLWGKTQTASPSTPTSAEPAPQAASKAT